MAIKQRGVLPLYSTSVQKIIDKLSISNDMNRYITRSLIKTHFPNTPLPVVNEMTQEDVVKQYDYNSRTGNLHYKSDGFRCKAGDIACWLGGGEPHRKIVYYNGKQRAQSRMVWFWHYGFMPYRLYWQNEDRLDDRIENLGQSMPLPASIRNQNKSPSQKWLDEFDVKMDEIARHILTCV